MYPYEVYDARGNGGGVLCRPSPATTKTELPTTRLLPFECYTKTSYGQYAEGVGTLRADGGDVGGAVKTLSCYGFKPQQGEKANGIGFEEEIVPTLSAAVPYAGGVF